MRLHYGSYSDLADADQVIAIVAMLGEEYRHTPPSK